MTDILEKTRQSSPRPTVEKPRPEQTDDGPTLVQAVVSPEELKAFNFAELDEAREREIKRADARGQASRLRFEAMAPIFKLIEADEKAKDALKRSDLIIHEIGLAAGAPRIRSDPIGTPIQWGWSLDPGFNVFGKPYNGERQGPTHGTGATAAANRNTAEMTVTIPFDKDSEGTRSAEASLQFIFEAKVPGNVSLRPFIQYEGQSIIEGKWLSAYSRGVLFISAAKWFDQSTLVTREEVLWDHETETLDTAFASGSIGSMWLDLPISPGEPLIVSIGIRITGNQSGDEYMGWPLSFRSYSYFLSTLFARLPFMVAKLN